MTPTKVRTLLIIAALVTCGTCALCPAVQAEQVCLQVRHFGERSPKCIPVEGLQEAIVMAFSVFPDVDVAEVLIKTPKKRFFGIFPLASLFVRHKPLVVFTTRTVAPAPTVVPYRAP